MPAIGTDEKISEILSALLAYRKPDTEDVRCAIDSIMRLIEEERAACEKIADDVWKAAEFYDRRQNARSAAHRIRSAIRERGLIKPEPT